MRPTTLKTAPVTIRTSPMTSIDRCDGASDGDFSHPEPDDEVVHDEEPGHAPGLDPAAVASDDFAVLVVVRAEVEHDRDRDQEEGDEDHHVDGDRQRRLREQGRVLQSLRRRSIAAPVHHVVRRERDAFEVRRDDVHALLAHRLRVEVVAVDERGDRDAERVRVDELGAPLGRPRQVAVGQDLRDLVPAA